MEPLHPGDPARIGPFELVARLGAGGMGQVYLGRDAHGQQAAVKVVHPGLASDPGFRSRFAREIETARRVHSPWTAAVLTADAQARPPWLASTYVPGPSLDQVVDTAGPLPESATTVLASRLAHALAHLHAAGVVHRDLKPSNVLLAPDGPRLIDFGIARAADATRITHTGAVIGTPAFMSPEQAAGDDAGAPSDVFSLAAVLTYAATGTGPFGSTTNPMAVLLRISDDEPDISGLPEALRTHLESCFAKEPSARPTAPELAERLAPAGRAAAEEVGLPSVASTRADRPGSPAGVETRIAPVFPPQATPPRPRRLPWMAALGALVGVAAIVTTAVLLTWPVDAPETAAAGPATGTPAPQATSAPTPVGEATVAGTIRVGQLPDDVVVAPGGALAYAVNTSDISVIDTATGAVTATIGVPGPNGAVFTPDGTRAYVPLGSGFVSVLDTATNTQITAVPTAMNPRGAVITPDGRAVHVLEADYGGASTEPAWAVEVIDTATNTVTASVPVPLGPGFLAAAPDSRSVWAYSRETRTFSVIDTATNTISGTLRIPDGAEAVAFANDGSRVYVLNTVSSAISVFDGASRAKLGEIRTPAGYGLPADLTVSPSGRYVFMSMAVRGDTQDPAAGAQAVIRVIDTTTSFVIEDIALGTPPDHHPGKIALAPDGHTLYTVINDLSSTAPTGVGGTLVVVDTTPYA